MLIDFKAHILRGRDVVDEERYSGVRGSEQVRGYSV
jgi:hypothetical protein